MAEANVTAVSEKLDTVVPESTPFIKTFIPVTETAVPALLGAEVKVRAVVVVAAALSADALAAVFTRRIDSLFKVTSDVPNVLGDDVVLGL